MTGQKLQRNFGQICHLLKFSTLAIIATTTTTIKFIFMLQKGVHLYKGVIVIQSFYK